MPERYRGRPAGAPARAGGSRAVAAIRSAARRWQRDRHLPPGARRPRRLGDAADQPQPHLGDDLGQLGQRRDGELRTASEPDPTANGATHEVAISADGRYVAFHTDATDVLTGVTDTNGASDLYLWDRLGTPTRLVSRLEGTLLVTGGNGGVAGRVRLTADGSRVAFSSDADDHVGGDDNETFDVFYFGPEEIFTDGFARGTPYAWSDSQP